MSRRIVWALSALFVAVPVYSTAAAQAAQNAVDSASVQHQMIVNPVDEVVGGVCNNTPMSVHVTATERFNLTRILDGTSVHQVLDLDYSGGHGTDLTTGASYVYGQHLHENEVVDPSSGFVDVMQRQRLIGQGGAPNFTLQTVMRVTWNGSQATIKEMQASISCN